MTRLFHNWIFSKNKRGSVSVKTIVKEALTELDIPFTDACCPTDADLENLTNRELTALVGNVGTAPIVQRFLASDTYTPTPGMIYCKVQVQAGGGGSGGTSTTAGGEDSVGMAGGGGAYSEALIPAASIGVTETITVGAGGLAGAVAAIGGTGGTSSFGTHVVCAGGVGGTTNFTVGTLVTITAIAGGVVTTAGEIIAKNGEYSDTYSSALGVAKGGHSFLGFSHALYGTAVGLGAGAPSNRLGASQTQRVGQVGGAGVVIVTEYF